MPSSWKFLEYQAERDAVRLTVRTKRRQCIITPRMDLDTIFAAPLTLVVRGDWNQRTSLAAKQGDRALAVTVGDGMAWVDFDPHGGKIRVSWRE